MRLRKDFVIWELLLRKCTAWNMLNMLRGSRLVSNLTLVVSLDLQFWNETPAVIHLPCFWVTLARVTHRKLPICFFQIVYVKDYLQEDFVVDEDSSTVLLVQLEEETVEQGITRKKSFARVWYLEAFMLIRDNKFWWIHPTRRNVKNKHDVCINTYFSQSLKTYQRASLLVWRKIEHVCPPQTTECIPYEHFIHTLNPIDVCAIERSPHTTGVFKFRACKGNIKGLKSIRVPKKPFQPWHQYAQ
jgi:hypothetical protein